MTRVEDMMNDIRPQCGLELRICNYFNELAAHNSNCVEIVEADVI